LHTVKDGRTPRDWNTWHRRTVAQYSGGHGPYRDPNKTVKSKQTGYNPWSQSVSEFIQDAAGNAIKNPLWNAPVKQGSSYNGKKVTWSKTPSRYSAPIDPELRVNTDSEYLLGNSTANTAYNSDVNQRQRNLELTNLNYGDSKMRLAQQRTQDLRNIDQRAARAGVAFSQGRVNARNQYDTNYNANADRAYASNLAANTQFGTQNTDAAAVRNNTLAQVRQNVIDKLSARDEQDKLANPTINWQTPNAQFQSLDQKTGKRYRVVKGVKVYG
jgi:hypothetical protein